VEVAVIARLKTQLRIRRNRVAQPPQRIFQMPGQTSSAANPYVHVIALRWILLSFSKCFPRPDVVALIHQGDA